MESAGHLTLLRYAIALFVFFPMLYLVHKRMSRGELSYTLGFVWTAAFIVGLICSLFPGLLIGFSEIVGTKIPANLLFAGAILFLAVIGFNLSLRSSAQAKAITILCQQIGLFQAELTEQRKLLADSDSEKRPSAFNQ